MDGLSLKLTSAEETIRNCELLVFSSLQNHSVSAMMCWTLHSLIYHSTMCWTFCISNAGGKEIEELKSEKEKNDRFYKDEQRKTTNLIEEKGERILLLSVQRLSHLH